MIYNITDNLPVCPQWGPVLKWKNGEIEMIRKIFGAVLVLLALLVGYSGVRLALDNLNAEPVLVEVPEAARTQALSMMDALCTGDYVAVSQSLYGQPDLGMDRDPADYVGQLFYDAYAQSLRYELVRDCYATAAGVALDVRVPALDVYALLPHLRQEAEALLEQRVAQAESVSDVYDENGEYLETLVEEVLHSSAAQVLEHPSTIAVNLTLECVFEDGQWWIRPHSTLLDIIGCKLGKQEGKA